jgi:hypothetical protein
MGRAGIATLLRICWRTVWFKLNRRNLAVAKRIKRNVKPLAKGDVFVVTNNLDFVDVDGDGVTDAVFTHKATKNGSLFVESQLTWYGLDDTGIAAIREAFAAGGFGQGTHELRGFKALCREWRKHTKALAKLDDLGEAAADVQGLD